MRGIGKKKLYKKQTFSTSQSKMFFENLYLSEDPWESRNSIWGGVLRTTLQEVFENRTFTNGIDIGCGEGHLISSMNLSEHTVGVDISATAILRAKNNYPDINFIQNDIRDPFGNKNKFNIVTAFDFLYYFEEDEVSDVLKNIKQLGEKSATFAFSIVVDPYYSQDRTYFDLNYWLTTISKEFKIVSVRVIEYNVQKSRFACYIHAIKSKVLSKRYQILTLKKSLERIPLSEAAKVLVIAESND